jgi:acyl-CoA thioesterase I
VLRIALYFASANAFFAGCGLLIAGAVLRMIFVRRRVVLAARLCVGLGAVSIALSSTPWHVWVYALWALMTLWLLADPHRRKGASIWRVYCVPLIVIGLSIYGSVREARCRRAPERAAIAPICVVVIGDSISAKLDNDITPWPELLRERHGIKVVNASSPGATQVDAIKAVQELNFKDLGACTVVLEIGGNDILGRCEGGGFHEELEQLLYLVSHPKCSVYLLELPLIPFQNHYAAAQRKLAGRYDAELIPKSYFARILRHAEDGLHLSQEGQEKMAEMVWEIIAPPARKP